MKYKFYSPFLIWFGIWIFISLLMLLITLHIYQLNLQSSQARERLLFFNHSHPSFSPQFSFSGAPWDYRRQFRSGAGDRGWRDTSPEPLAPPSPLENLWTRHLLLKEQQKAASAGHLFTGVSYLLFVVGFGAICLITAIYQNYFRRSLEEQFEVEIEARNLRIQVLESSRDALDLKLQLLDQNHARARAAAGEAQENLRNLEEKLQSEAERNEELQAELEKAEKEEKQALKSLRVLERDRRKLAAEKMDIAFRLMEAERALLEDRYPRKVRKARGRLRLNPIWLTSLYPNLSFSPRALQNIGELQEVSAIFPSLPDALAKIDKISYKALKSGEKFPPKTVARFATHDLEHFQGPFWEYRFSADGRIFFGLSKSRTWNIDTILLKRRFPDKKEKYDRYLAVTLGKDNQDLRRE